MEKFVDIALIAIIVICAWTGYKKGLIMGIGGVLIIIASLYLGNLVSHTFSYEVIPALRPFVSGYMETNYKRAIYNELDLALPEAEESGISIMDLLRGGDDGEGATTPPVATVPALSADIENKKTTIYSLEDLIRQNPEIERSVFVESIKSIGIFAKPANIIADEVLEYEEKNEISRFDSLVNVLCEKLTYVIGFIMSFLLILIILTVAGNLLNISFKIPGFDLLNDISGAIIGIATGLILCVVAVWILKFTGIIFSEEQLNDSVITMWFMGRDVLGEFLGI